MNKRGVFDSFLNDFFEERDQYFDTISNRMNSLYQDINNTYESLLQDEEMEDDEKQEKPVVQKLKHYESKNVRTYVDDMGRKHFFERKIENLPNDENKYKVITTKRIVPKDKSIEDIKKIPKSKLKSDIKDASEKDFIESVTEEVRESLPDTHFEMLDNWFGRNLIENKSIEQPKEKKEDKKETSQKKQLNEKQGNEDNKQRIENLRKEFNEQFKSIEKQFETMKKKVFNKLNSEEMLESSKQSKV